MYVFIQGGGFNSNGNANFNGSDLVRASGDGIVVVNFNYRVGPYGFLASKEIVDNTTLSLNNGLKDQRQLLKWVNKYIDQVCHTQIVQDGSKGRCRAIVLPALSNLCPVAVHVLPLLTNTVWRRSWPCHSRRCQRRRRIDHLTAHGLWRT